MAIDLHNLLQLIEEEKETRGPKITIYLPLVHSSDFAIIAKAELKTLTKRALARAETHGASAS